MKIDKVHTTHTYWGAPFFAVYTNGGERLGAFKTRELAELFAKAFDEQPKRVRLMAGNNYIHIAKDGKALCGRADRVHGPLVKTNCSHPTCAGCIAKSLGIVARAEAS